MNMILSSEEIFSIIKIVEQVFLAAKNTICPDRNGFYFCLTDKDSGKPLVIVEIGTVPEEKISKYLGFSQEKASRLYICSEHLLSWQSRNEKEDKWAGAIKTPTHIFSCSGLPELFDEAVMLVSAVKVGHLNIDEAYEMSQISGSEKTFFALLGAVK